MGRHVFTYGDVWQHAVAIAERLSSLSARRVAIESARDEKLIAAVIGVILADCELLLLDPDLPVERREGMIAISAADVVVRIGSGEELYERRDTRGEEHPSSDYIFFTSGTTGTPKAIAGRWDSVLHFIRWQGETFHIDHRDRFAQLTSVSFDVFLRDIFTPLSVGATICIPTKSEVSSPARVMSWLADTSISVLHTVPSLASKWLTSVDSASAEKGGGLALTFFAGEPLTERLVRGWREANPSSRVVNLYGPSETCLAKFWHEVEDPYDGLQPVGRPLPGTTFRIVDHEIWINTRYGTNGYLGEDAHSSSFSTDEVGDIWYRTGDMGRVKDDLLWVAGRRDLQVKINGNRIELEGVAAVLSGHSDVRHAVVAAWTRDHPETTFLAAYYVAASDAGLTPSELTSWLAQKLPLSHIPSFYVRLPEIPTTPNGKVDRKSLPDPHSRPSGGSRRDDTNITSEPSTELARQVLEQFRIVLDAPLATMDTDFFDAGGSSLEAVELTVRLEDLTRRSWMISDIYRLRRPKSLVDDVTNHPSLSNTRIPARAHQPRRTGLSPQQRRYRTVYLPTENRSWSNMVNVLPLADGTSVEKLSHALSVIVGRHDSLRASFSISTDGSMDQHFTAATTTSISVADLTGLSDPRARDEVDRLRRAQANDVIDVSSWPLFRSTLVLLDDQRRVFLWSIHHLVSDGYSQGLLYAELATILRGADVSDLPALPISYRDYIQWASLDSTGDSDGDARWWKSVFSTPYDRPLLKQSPIENAAHGVSYHLPLPDDLHASIENYCRRQGATVFAVLLTSFFETCFELYSRADLVIGTPASGRRRIEVENVIGNFISLVCIRMRSDEGSTLDEKVRLVRDRTASAMEHQDYQYDSVMELVGARPDDDRFPLTTVFFSLVDAHADLPLSPTFRDLGLEVKFDLMGYVKQRGGRLWIEFQTRRGLLSHADLERIGSRFLDITYRLAAQ